MASRSSSPGTIQFERLPNFRDVGTSINTLSNQTILKPSLLYRSARPDEATPSDRTTLLSTLKVHTILDLRSKTEHQQQDRKRASDPSLPTNHAVKIPGITYIPLNFNGTAFSMGLMRQMAWSSSARLIYLMALGQRTEAISILGREVMAPRGLVGSGIDSLTFCTGEVLAAFKVLSEEKNYPLLVHCTQGKDRTGLVVLLVLLLCEVDTEAVKGDYLASQKELAGEERKEKLEEIRSIGLPDVFADCPEDWVEKVAGHIDQQYGGVEKYLARCGVTREMQKNVRRILMCDERTS